MYSKHGPPLSLDKQLRRILQQKVFHSIPILPGRKYRIRSATTNISNRSLAYSNFQSSINHNNPHMHQTHSHYLLDRNTVTNNDLHGISYDFGVSE